MSWGAIGAGLTPIAVGYLVAHYLTYLLIDGQRIIVAVSDPLQTGADLIGTAFYTPTALMAPGLVWTVQLAAVVGGHVLGAWAGHVTAQRDAAAMSQAKPPRDMRHRKIPGTSSRRIPNVRHARDPARRDHGRADDADAVVAGPVDRPGGAGGARPAAPIAAVPARRD